MVIFKLIKSINKISFNIFLNVLLYCIKKITHYKANKKEINLKKLVLCIDKLNAKLIDHNDNLYSISFISNNRNIKLLLRNENFSDIGILYEFIFENEYEILYQIMNKHYLSSEKMNVVDLGGNIGLFCLHTNLRFPNASLFYVEPDIEAIIHFEKILEINNISKPIIYNNGIADVSGANIHLINGPRGVENAGFVTIKTYESSILKTISIQKIIENSNINLIDVLKIDIEGAEEELILGNNFNSQLAKYIKFIAIEIHDDQVNRIKIENKLLDLNFSKINNQRVDIFKNNAIN